MRTTFKTQGVKDYWTDRWADIPADRAMTNSEGYPLKYALQTVTANDGPILEAGCGAGRILRYYHERGYDITGIDFIEVAIDKLREVDPMLQVEIGDITALRARPVLQYLRVARAQAMKCQGRDCDEGGC